MKVYSDESDNLHYNQKVVQRSVYYKILLHFKEYYVLFIILFYLFK